jgi:predicted enzyme related to lactoylglutathione lyase
MADMSARGRFVWYDLMTTDPQQAEAFYTKTVGWSTEAWQGGPMPYHMWKADGKTMGGVMQLPANAGAPPHWLAYIAVPDVDATVNDAESRGAKALHRPTDIPTVGRYAVLSDPQGAVFAVFTSAGNAPGHEGAPTMGEFSWHELATTDIDAAFTFYEALFGWEKKDEDMGPLGIYRIFSRKGIQLGGMFNKPADMPFPPHWLQYVMVDSARAAADRVAANAGKILNGPTEVPGGDWIAQCLDPQGAPFAVHSKNP